MDSQETEKHYCFFIWEEEVIFSPQMAELYTVHFGPYPVFISMIIQTEMSTLILITTETTLIMRPLIKVNKGA